MLLPRPVAVLPPSAVSYLCIRCSNICDRRLQTWKLLQVRGRASPWGAVRRLRHRNIFAGDKQNQKVIKASYVFTGNQYLKTSEDHCTVRNSRESSNICLSTKCVYGLDFNRLASRSSVTKKPLHTGQGNIKHIQLVASNA